ncbi:MAG: DEAD/DEAH box helicase [Dehalococcoidales bacterium]|nr:DEAD/DEAH box helicase [Dehalococcoidales bacterium]
MNFDTFNLNPGVMDGVRALGYSTPTPIQLQAIPPIIQGHDLIGLAQTGTGKTAAFVLPILHHLISSPHGQVRALILAPTRELAEQTDTVITGLGQKTGLRNMAIYGGANMEQQIQKLRNGVEIVTACPGRLLDHLWKGSIDLSNLEILVIDEADRMLDMGFLPDIKNILKCLMQKRQTLLFSATMPANIRRLAEEIMHKPVTVQINPTTTAATVSHTIYSVEDSQKTSLLKDILEYTKTESVLVFTRTKYRAQRIAQQLKNTGCRATSLQGNLNQNQRQLAMEGFCNGSVKVLVATDIAARGIDVLSITHVINYDMPGSMDDYIHRIGRTGRIGKVGQAFTFVTAKDAAMERDLRHLLDKGKTEYHTVQYKERIEKPQRQGVIRNKPVYVPRKAFSTV